MTYDPRADEVRRRLAHYFEANPLASDTAEGISRWWMPGEWGVTEAEVLEALVWLLREGVVEELIAADGRVRYRRVRGDAAAAALAKLLQALAETQEDRPRGVSHE